MNIPRYLGGMLLGLMLVVGGIARILYFSDMGNLMMSIIFFAVGLMMFSYYYIKSRKSVD